MAIAAVKADLSKYRLRLIAVSRPAKLNVCRRGEQTLKKSCPA